MISLQIKRCVSSEGHPFSDLLFVTTTRGVVQHYCTRLWYVVDETPYAIEQEIAKFKQRQQREIG